MDAPRRDDAGSVHGVYLDSSVELAEDVTLEPNVILRGRTRVGQGTTIAAGSTIELNRRRALYWACYAPEFGCPFT